MKLVIAQGNPGTQYAKSRHNVGFMTLDGQAASMGVSFTEKPKFKADVAEITITGERVLLAKPTTFYNETGRAARAMVDFYKLDLASDVLVVHDDIALPFGTLRVRQKGSDAGNNGIKSLNAHLGPDYWRLRIGIYSDLRDRMHDADFVLGTFSQAEQTALKADILPRAAELIERFYRGELESESHSVTPTPAI